VSLEAFYRAAGVSRQAAFCQRQAGIRWQNIKAWVEGQVAQIRKDHPREGARKAYCRLQKEAQNQPLLKGTGRDKFEEIVFECGLKLRIIRSYTKTTISGSFRFPNLIEGLTIDHIDLVWVSDITYFQVFEPGADKPLTTFYLTEVLDAYSRRCLGIAWSRTLKTEDTTIRAMLMALQTRQVERFENLILHSDGGGQYYDKEFLKLLEKYGIYSSMGKSVYENPIAERFHSTLKNDYLIPWKVNSIAQLGVAVTRFFHLYNHDRAHSSIGRMTPVEFEKHIALLQPFQRTKMTFKKIE
jgi:transposase InsO family protein